MTDLLERGMAWLANQLQVHAAQPVVYVRGNDWIDVKATLGRTVFALDQEIAGVPVEYGEADFLIRASDLVLAAERIEPRDHDEIWWTSDGVTRVYEALAPGNEPSWRYADPFRQLVRIHTKFIRTELFEMPGSLYSVTLYRGSETRTIQVALDQSQCTEIDFRQFAGGAIRVPAGSPLHGQLLSIYGAMAPGLMYAPLLDKDGNAITIMLNADSTVELPDACYAFGALRLSAGSTAPLELVLKT